MNAVKWKPYKNPMLRTYLSPSPKKKHSLMPPIYKGLFWVYITSCFKNQISYISLPPHRIPFQRHSSKASVICWTCSLLKTSSRRSTSRNFMVFERDDFGVLLTRYFWLKMFSVGGWTYWNQFWKNGFGQSFSTKGWIYNVPLKPTPSKKNCSISMKYVFNY